MRTFTMYRRGDLSATHDENQANSPDEPQFEGVVFDDGHVAVRWMTAKRSTSCWDSLDDMLAIHGHPEYDSVLVWGDTRTERDTLSERDLRIATCIVTGGLSEIDSCDDEPETDDPREER